MLMARRNKDLFVNYFMLSIMSIINPYELLGVDCKSTREDIRKSFKALSLICHPDKGGDAEEMKILHNAYRYVIHQIEFQEHGRTKEEEEEKFKKFLEEQEDGKLPSFFEIMTDEANKKFNEMWDEKNVEIFDMCYPSNYEEKIKREPEKFSTEIIEYKEPKTIAEIGFSSVLDFTVNPVKDFSDYQGGVGYDYVLAHSQEENSKEIELKDVMSEYEILKKKREEEDKILCEKKVSVKIL